MNLELSTAQKILLGIQIIMKYESSAELATGRDIIYFGNTEEIADFVSTEDRQELANLGWFEQEESWAHYV